MRVGAWAAFIAAACAIANLAAMLVAVRFDAARLHDFAGLHDVDARGARWLVASMVVDALFYLCLAPVAHALASSVRGKAGSAQRAAGSAYALLGAAGALILVIVWPGLFARAAQGDIDAVAEFARVTGFVYRVLWNGACATVGAVWWLLVARTWRRDRRALAVVSLVLSVASAVEAAAVIAGAHAFADAVLDPYLALLPIWAVAAGWSLRARPDDAMLRP